MKFDFELHFHFFINGHYLKVPYFPSFGFMQSVNLMQLGLDMAMQKDIEQGVICFYLSLLGLESRTSHIPTLSPCHLRQASKASARSDMIKKF